MKLEIWASIAFGAAACAFGQSAARVEFEVVSIKPSPEPTPGQGRRVGCDGGPGSKDPGMYRCTNMSLSNLITSAYGIAHYQLSGPDWMMGQMFEIAAKIPEGTSKDDFKLMLQNMLADRFKLAAHHETRDMAKYELVAAKGGPKLKESVDRPTAPDAPPPNPGPPGPPKRDAEGYPVLAAGRPSMAMMGGKARMFNPKMTLDQLASQLGAQLGSPCTNATGLTAKYEIGLYWAFGSVRAAPPGTDGVAASEPEGPTLEQAVQEQLGLKLEAKKGPVDFLVVDHLDKMPIEN